MAIWGNLTLLKSTAGTVEILVILKFIKKKVCLKTQDLRLISYHHKVAFRGFYSDDWWKSLSSEDVTLLFQNWTEMVNYYYQEYPHIILLPLAAHYFDVMLNIPNKAMNIIKQFDKIVDLSAL